MIKIEWHKTSPEDALKHEPTVVSDIKNNLKDVSDPADLCFHHIPLGDGWDGPLVFVWGVAGSDAFHCEYVEKPVWKTLKQIEEDEKDET